MGILKDVKATEMALEMIFIPQIFQVKKANWREYTDIILIHLHYIV